MRVLMFSWEFPPHVVGGLGAHVASLVPALAGRGVDVTVVTPRWSGGDAVSRISAHANVYRVDPPVARLGNFYADVQQTNINLEELADRFWGRATADGEPDGPAFDLIHAHDWLVSFAADSLKRLHKTPLVATFHATERGRGRGQLVGDMAQAINGSEWWLSYEAWRVVTVSHYMADELKSSFQLPPDKIDVVPNGIATTAFDSLEGHDLTEFRSRWARPGQPLVFFVGRMQHEKGAHILVDAAPQVLDEFPETCFVLAGTGPMLDTLRRRVSELKLDDRVSITGFIQDADRNRLFRTANVSVFPSLYEPFGIVALEAMGSKCPVVASSVGGLREVVQHNQTGLLVHPENVESLAWGIKETLRDPAKASVRAALAYETVCRDYNWDRIAERTIEVYDRVIGERGQVKWD